MISGEYLVLHGAESLAVPTRAGQNLYVHERPGQELLEWKSIILSKPWFTCLDYAGLLEIMETNKPEIAARLVNMLRAAVKLKGNSEWLNEVSVISEIGFDIEWGLGSSSSLISNIAWWAGIDPFHLSGIISQGSGYDIACARSDGPIIYKIDSGRHIQKVVFKPAFSENLGFLYLGKKQDSSSSVKNFLNKALVKEKDITRISEITRLLISAEGLKEYEELLTEHEAILSGVLDRPAMKEVLFRDYRGIVKSLGAWGGDFVHISMDQGIEAARDYFTRKGFNIIIPYSEMFIPS